ncbi:hypothetical protein VTL71DRAFT_7509 [Oculimacula yallundae]|uniref:Uncharacterized protein n=1 Tax=Oculimacula yallundae TaxID=86028 RepID=A0ABR4BVH6_9HELO
MSIPCHPSNPAFCLTYRKFLLRPLSLPNSFILAVLQSSSFTRLQPGYLSSLSLYPVAGQFHAFLRFISLTIPPASSAKRPAISPDCKCAPVILFQEDAHLEQGQALLEIALCTKVIPTKIVLGSFIFETPLYPQTPAVRSRRRGFGGKTLLQTCIPLLPLLPTTGP